MAKTAKSVTDRKRRHRRIRQRVSGTSELPRLNVFRSTQQIYAQIIDDVEGKTIVSASTIDKVVAPELEGKDKKAQAAYVGKVLASRAKDAGIESVVFDRGGFRYHGRVKALADGAREGGLKF